MSGKDPQHQVLLLLLPPLAHSERFVRMQKEAKKRERKDVVKKLEEVNRPLDQREVCRSVDAVAWGRTAFCTGLTERARAESE